LKEINNILAAYRKTKLETALATVVKVEGSSYRQPGARMLITEEGELTGAISGGCLEGDALKKALLAIHQRKNKLVTYDTSGRDGTEISVQLGCNGIVHILFEYIDPDNEFNAIQLLQNLVNERKEGVLITEFSLENSHQVGTRLPNALDESDLMENALFSKCSLLSKSKHSELLVEYIAPNIQLIVVGAGNDAQPLVELSAILGWDVIVIDGRATHAVSKRFLKAKEVMVLKPEEILSAITVDHRTVFVLMTHNYNYDLNTLKQIVGSSSPYIGILGPKTKLQKIKEDFTLTDEQLKKIFSPMGLDIGAENSEQIGFSVMAEIQAVLNQRDGGMLKYITSKIHQPIKFIV
jgi:xanthine dehydrogenase accessory factor